MSEWTTLAAVRDQLELPQLALGATDDTHQGRRLVRVVAAVNGWLDAWLGPLAGDPAPGHALGATMLAARLARRHNSPEGVLAITGDQVAWVARRDPDVALLLGLDRPAVG